MFNTHPNTVNVQRHHPNTIQYPPKHSPGTIYALIEVNRNKLHQQTLPDTRPLKSVGVPPTAKLWPDWSTQKRVNRDKLDQKALVPPNSFGPPPMGGVGVDLKDRGFTQGAQELSRCFWWWLLAWLYITIRWWFQQLSQILSWYGCDINAKRLIMIMTVAMITKMNSNALTNIFTWEGFLLLSIYLLMGGKSRCLIAALPSQSCNLQQQARPVWNTKERELDNLWIFSPARRYLWENWCSRGNI